MIELLRNKQYTLSDIQKLKQKAHVVVDHIDIWLSNLFEVTHPEFLYHKDRLKKQAQFIESHLKSMKRKDLYGSWAYYKGNSTLVHVLNKKDYFTVLTARNHDVFTENEHKLLRTKRIGIIGQSVGGNVAVVAAHAGAGKLSIADFDRLEGTNLNRVLFGSAVDVGRQKIDIVTDTVLQVNPYIDIRTFDSGLSKKNIGNFFKNIDIVVELCDDFPIKILARREAKKRKIPLIMTTSLGRWLLVDVERYDLDSRTKFFNGLVEGDILEDIEQGKISLEDMKKYSRDLVGTKNIDPRALKSLAKIAVQKGLAGRPQVISTVAINAGVTLHCLIWCLGGFPEHGKLRSGRRLIRIDNLLVKDV
ncbi:hypothetical protein A3D06_02165 [Candidatus Roizmanbacteria bacterium RIFCSPHIGHO2_02_FULL_40_9]|uniref:THIF-type NAD/FAD binding fold domain-containing protein n=1 Tax=Candidatus Roizmanbacteria bacterium RIFCSPHIGHO2_02_FULL_40_9 TaxID=1802042 RepID=A0A1F7HC58_9BACT|nr:MAG: hypothetical protein A3D06_02165 [Candidatus Roizmanbacteria bacterium RIFCSPHIGHO2_02_FULL_40_9]